MAPFHQKMTALLYARSCEVTPPLIFGFTTSGVASIVEQAGKDDGDAAASFDDRVLVVSA